MGFAVKPRSGTVTPEPEVPRCWRTEERGVPTARRPLEGPAGGEVRDCPQGVTNRPFLGLQPAGITGSCWSVAGAQAPLQTPCQNPAARQGENSSWEGGSATFREVPKDQDSACCSTSRLWPVPDTALPCALCLSKAPDPGCAINLSGRMDMVHVCTVQGSGHRPPVLLSSRNVASATKELDFNLILINLNSHLCVLAITLDSPRISEPKGTLEITEPSDLTLQRKKLDQGLWSRERAFNARPHQSAHG